MKSKKLFFIFLALILLGYSSGIQAQLIINNTTYTTPSAAESLVNNILLGQGVVASNITFTPAAGSTIQLGFFNGIGSNIGLDSGIVLSTGNIMDLAPGGMGTGQPPGGSDQDLLTLANSVPPLIGQSFSVSSTNDVAILEFDFVPSADTVKFRYVFGSDEYTTWINSQYNDVFGFFISGPGITGPFTGNSQNIAFVPGTNPPLPITVSSVQPGLNAQYYISNTSQSTVALNGFTTVFTAISPVVCGETYHIRLAIADGSDSSLDSGVFLEASSFTSNAVNLVSNTVSGDTTLVEGCTDGTFTFYRPGSLADSLLLPITVTGTATAGADYNALPDTVIFLPGQNTVQFTVNPINDGVSENPESIIVSFTQDACGTLFFTSSLWIIDLVPVTASTQDTALVCPNTPITISAQYSGGGPPYSVVWSTGETTNSIQVNPATTTTYSYTVTDFCSPDSAVGTVTVDIPVFSPLTLTGTASNVLCPNGTSQLTATATGGFPGYTYIWTLNGNIVSDSVSMTSIPLSNDTVYVVTVNDACGTPPVSQNVTVTTVPYVAINLDLGADITVPCPNTGVNLVPAFSQGAAPYIFNWSNGAVPISGDSAAIAQPAVSTTYYLTMTDACNQAPVKDSVKVLIAVNPELLAKASKDTTVCKGNPVTLSVIAEGGAGSYSYLWQDLTTLAGFDNNTGVSISPIIENTISYLITVTDLCGVTAIDTVNVPLRTDCDVVVPNIITPNGDAENQYLVFTNIELFPQPKLEVFNRWGNKIYESDNYQNNWAPVELNPGVYYFTLELGTIDPKKGFFQVIK